MNLLGAFKDLAGDQLADLAGNVIGASKNETSAALGSVLPSILGSVLGNVQDEKSAGGFLDFLGNNNLGGSLLGNIGDLFGTPAKQEGLMGMGSTVLNFLMGNKTNAVIDLLTRVTGMNNTKIGSLLKIAAPLLMSFIGKKAKADNLGASGLLSLMNSQKSFLKDSAPKGLFDSLGLGSLGSSIMGVANNMADGARDAGRAASGAARNVANTASGAAGAAVDAGKSGISKLLPWLGLALAALVALFLWKQCGSDVKDAANAAVDQTEKIAKKAGNTVVDGAKAVGNAAGEAVDATGDALNKAGEAVADAFKSLKLPNGQEIKSKAGSMIDQMSGYFATKDAKLNRRFTFDGVNFKTGSAQLTGESSAQLDNLVALMKAYENSAIRVEGHTDNTGNADANMKLSTQRALAVKNYLMQKGISGNRVASKGHGQMKPIADNGTEEGRAQNRRVDVYVTKK